MTMTRLSVAGAVVVAVTALLVPYAVWTQPAFFIDGFFFATGAILIFAAILILIVTAIVVVGIPWKAAPPFIKSAAAVLTGVGLFMLVSVAFSVLSQAEFGGLSWVFRIMAFGTLAGYALLMTGVLWAPFGGRMCSRLASNRQDRWELPVRDGALASILFLLPWFYLVSLVRDKPLSVRTIWTGYVMIFGLWLFGPGGLMLSLAAGMFVLGYEAVSGTGTHGGPLAVALVPSGFVSIGLLATGWLWYRSIKHLLKFQRWNRRPANGMTGSSMPAGYLDPFKPALASYVVTYAAGTLTLFAGLAVTSN